MQVEFPRENDLSQEDAFKKYEFLIDSHLYFLKRQSKCEFSYWKGTRIFFLISVALYFLYGNGLISTPLVGIFFSGMGCLLVFAQTLSMDFQYGKQAAVCRKDGLSIEKKLNYPVTLMKTFEETKYSSYLGHLLSRLFPIGIVALATVLAGTILALKLATWIAAAVGISSIAALLISVCFFIKITRKNICGDV